MDSSSSHHHQQPEKRRRLERVSAACDLCKTRKVKCNGQLPCSYCQRKNRADTCSFSTPRTRGEGPAVRVSPTAGNTPVNGLLGGPTPQPSREQAGSDPSLRTDFEPDRGAGYGPELSPTGSRDGHHEDTAVPLEARLLRDAQGKAIFIGDCAPLSFLQTVRHLIASELDPHEFPAQTARDSVIEVAQPAAVEEQQASTIAVPAFSDVEPLFRQYLIATNGLVDLFDRDKLLADLQSWASGMAASKQGVVLATCYLVFAIGAQESDETKAEIWLKHSQAMLLQNMCSSMTVATVQGFALLAVYMLRAFQPNAAYLYFALASRTGYAIGLHRSEVNASFGPDVHALRDRDRIWKSLRVVDMLISNILGRPPSTSDVDCTVKYGGVSEATATPAHVLDASVHIFMIIERVVVEVYSRKRISLRIANYVSHQLKGWASRWVRPFREAINTRNENAASQEVLVGACQNLCSYFYGIMLLTRPFLIYDLYEYLGVSLRAPGTQAENKEKRRFADAALDAAAAFVETVQTAIKARQMPTRMPLVVSWLFTTSLVLAVGILGRSGLSLEDNCRASIRCLDYFAKVDPHAHQYSAIVHALLKTTTQHVKKREDEMHSQRKQASSQLFGLFPDEPDQQDAEEPPTASAEVQQHLHTTLSNQYLSSSSVAAPSDWNMYDADFFALPWVDENDLGLQDFLQPGRHTLDGSLADIPLFPMYDQSAHGTGGDF
ncbi:related to positive regulator of PUT (proline utilization) genes [Lecanosticta acicola]|uniref:Related to positive regulator of PUT (Proline utilization) genes n=1 Tax=Lecanosticta acicola TaxID=111012 RepID=A0AAI8YT12_9PEZI|nr:related to positive regulator of PUT (proline utilization) genes [Lecanosticta acicola]